MATSTPSPRFSAIRGLPAGEPGASGLSDTTVFYKTISGTQLGEVVDNLVIHLAGLMAENEGQVVSLEAISDWVDMQRRGVAEPVPGVNGCARTILSTHRKMLDAANGVVGMLCDKVDACASASLRQSLTWRSGGPNPYHLIRDWAREQDGAEQSPVQQKAQGVRAVAAARQQRKMQTQRQPLQPRGDPSGGRGQRRGSASSSPDRRPKSPRVSLTQASPKATEGRGRSPSTGQRRPSLEPPKPRTWARPSRLSAGCPSPVQERAGREGSPESRASNDPLMRTLKDTDAVRDIRTKLAQLQQAKPDTQLIAEMLEKEELRSRTPSPTRSSGGRHPLPEAGLVAGEMAKLLQTMQGLREQMRQLAEKGSPTDDDLAAMDSNQRKYDGHKYELADMLKALPKGCKVTPKDPQAAVDCLECLLQEGDQREGGPELVGALLDHVDASFSDLVERQGLVAAQCPDGNAQFLELLLSSLPPSSFDIPEVLAAACYSQTRRIPLVRVVLRLVDLAPFADECQPLLQEFFEDIASHSRAILREDRSDRPEVLRSLLSLPPELRPSAEGEASSDGMTVFARCVADGDLLLFDLLRQHAPGALQPSQELPDGTTPLQHAVLRGRTEMLRELLKLPSCELDKQTETGGTALGLAEALLREDIAQILRDAGACVSVAPHPD